MAEYEGTSDTANLEEALKKAVENALNEISHPDSMISYSVKRIHGRKGGFAGFNQLTVVIDVEGR